MDDTYQIYVNRVARMTLPEAHKSQAQHIQASPKFQKQADGTVEPVSFPGYSVITPPWAEETRNQAFYERLQAFQQQVLKQLQPDLLNPVPANSFHMTLADLIWNDAYRHAHDADPEFDAKLRDRISESFDKCQHLVQSEKLICWQAIGLFVRTRAVGVCLVPRNEDSYNRVVQLRRAIYQNSALMALGVEQQYHFTAHVTLGYFTDAVSDVDREPVGQTLIDLNQQWLDIEEPQDLQIHRAELRKFEDMTQYHRTDDFPVLEF